MEIEKKLNIDYRRSSILFERAMRKFQVRKVLYQTLFRGKGLEFEGYRNFDPQDDYNTIDWRSTLRSGVKMVKQYREERDLDVYFLVDCSQSMLFGSGDKLKAEYIGEIVCVLANLVLNTGDRAGLVMFSNKEVKVLRPSNKKNQLLIIHKYLSEFGNYGGTFKIEEALEFMSKFAGGISNNVVLLSDFIHIRRGFERGLSSLSLKADLFAIMVRDLLDESFPDGNFKFIVQDPNSNKQMIIDGAIAKRSFRTQSLKQKQRVKEIFIKKGIDLLELKNGEEFALPISYFMKKRAREFRI